MNEATLVSIVIPVYNVEKYIDRCLKSVINQTYSNLEIILVDDGSPDNCPQICDEWAKRDSRIKVIHKVNAGLGMARNTGIENANGKYIFFFDSDDFIDLNVVKDCVICAERDKAEIVMYGLFSVDDNEDVVEDNYPKSNKRLFKDNEIIDFILPNMLGRDPRTGKQLNFNMSASGRMFSLTLIKNCNWCFVSEREYISEDFYSLLDLYSHVKVHSIINKSYYYYCNNNSSLTHSFNTDRIDRINYCYREMKKLCVEKRYPREVLQCLYSQYIGSIVMGLKQIICADLPFQVKYKYFQKANSNTFLKQAILGCNKMTEPFQRKVLLFLMKHNLIILTMGVVKAKC